MKKLTLIALIALFAMPVASFAASSDTEDVTVTCTVEKFAEVQNLNTAGINIPFTGGSTSATVSATKLCDAYANYAAIVRVSWVPNTTSPKATIDSGSLVVAPSDAGATGGYALTALLAQEITVAFSATLQILNAADTGVGIGHFNIDISAS